ncbi:pheromone-processing carboxypeptidase KEX1-like [Arachis duranensis]|uniref:Pheromone-processing carboxypeptidase KEX1-like n=1 Tax=Arachis duranensis TaxID=130453 RepID=A0A9C6WKK0_ARADU|nr:pheromone-processing carboxypeptidase KEX1-like [Arachis duranensis]
MAIKEGRNGKLYADCVPWGRFGYEEGTFRYLGGEKTVIKDVDSDCWSLFEAYAELRQFGYTREDISALWYKDPCSEWIENALKLFATDKDALKMCKIANLMGHVEVFVMHVVEDAEEFPEAGFIDVGGRTEENLGNELVVYEGEKDEEMENDDVQKGSEGDKLDTDVGAENELAETNSDDDSDDEEFIPSDPEGDSAEEVHFTDSDEEYDDESGFEIDTTVKGSKKVDKDKGVMNGDFSDEEGFNSEEVDLEYELGVGSVDEEVEGEDKN